MFNKILRWLDINFEPILMAVLFYAITLLVTLQVILRFVFSSGFAWGEEVSRFMFVWLMYISISYATRNQRHIKVAFLVNKFPIEVRKKLMILTDVLFLTFCVIAFYGTVLVCRSTWEFQDMSVTVNVSLNIIFGAGILGFGLMVIRLIQSIAWKIKHFQSPLEVFENLTGVYTGADKICFLPKGFYRSTPEKGEAVEK